MAEAILYGVATNLINTLASLTFKEIVSTYGVATEIQRLKQTVEGIKAVLADACRKQQTDELVQLWIRDLKQVLYEADDLLDEIQTQHLLHKRDAKGTVMGKVRDIFTTSKSLAFRSKIREIVRQFNAVAENMSKLNLDRVVLDERKHGKSRERRETASFVIQEDMVGREGDKTKIIDLLRDRTVSLVAIVGIGGLGKTALAQLVYNDAEVESLFNKRIWVCVSQDFDVKTHIKLILKSLPCEREVKDDQPLELLQQELRKNLNGQKYLLVLDDVWNEDSQMWSALKQYLMCGAEGSKILVTTRNHAVAKAMRVEKSQYSLSKLPNDQSWTLMKRLAFDQGQKVTLKFESVGQKIANKCGGVPLAIRVMGSLLWKKSLSDWEDILEGDFWKGDDLVLPILKLSYDNLTIELKQCFAYCSLYPKDHRYNKDELIYLWMAQGFLESEEQCPEDVGEDYIRILLMKSFLQDVETDNLGEIIYFKMHDLMHDLSVTIASSDYGVYVEGRKKVVSHPIHASFKTCNSDSSRNMLDPRKLRTFLVIERPWPKRNPAELRVLKRLRSVDLSMYETKDLPKSIGNMSHLRYLNLYYCDGLKCLPRSISNLVNLQTLILNASFAEKFSGGDIITKLINLRRLDTRHSSAFDDGMPVGLGRMTNLQRLSHFVVGSDDKKRKKAKLSELKELNLRGELTIEKLDLVRDVEEESKDVNLRAKKKLISLTLDWGPGSKMKNSDAKQLLNNLQPHQNLKALTILGYPGESISDWLLLCENLVELSFFGIENCQYLVELERFVSLKTLRIAFMDKLEGIYYKGSSSSSSNFFPSLEELLIYGCGSLRGWLREVNLQNTRDDERHYSLPPFSRLSSLEIKDCPNLSCMPTFPNLVSDLKLIGGVNTRPLLDTLSGSNIVEPSTSHDVVAPLSMLKSLHIVGIDTKALPEEWMQNLSSLEHLSICKLYEDYNIKFQDLCCLHSLQKIRFDSCNHLMALPEWICDIQSLQFIKIWYCENLQSFPEGMHRLSNLQTLEMHGVPLLEEKCKRETGTEWPRIAHIPNILINDCPI